MQSNHIYNWFVLILLSVIWGSSYLLIKLSLLSFTPVQVALIRIALSGITLLPFFLKYAKTTSKNIWGWCLILGFIGYFVPFMSFAVAQTVISSSLAGMLNSLQPLFTLSLGILVFNQKASRNQIMGVLIGFAGAIILLSANTSSVPFSENLLFSLLVVLATFGYGVAANIMRVYLHDVSAMEITSITLGLLLLPSIAFILTTDLAAPFKQQQLMTSIYALVALSILGTAIAVIIYTKLLKSAGMMMASSVAYLIPVVAIILGILQGEAISIIQIAGISIIFAGLFLINQLRSE